MKQRTFTLMFMLVLFTIGYAAQAQYSVSGKVLDDASDEGLLGVTIQVRGTTVGAFTDAEGNFQITVPGNDPATLVFSYIGYLSQNVAVNAQSGSVTVRLKADVTNLEEVVVTGLASSVKRSNLANAVSSVSAKDLVGTTQIQTTDGALYGKVTGANIRMNSGAPGGGMSIQLRGISSLQGASQPLIILDGVYVNNSFQRTGRATVTGAGGSNQDDGSNRLADLNPAEIESIEVLKGPSAAAIYGTRANAGVIIITTKRGQAGRTNVTLAQDIGFGRPLKMMGVDDWSEEKINFFFPASRRPTELQRFRDAQASGNFINYEDYFYGNTATLSNTRLTISGGNEKTKFYVNGNMTDEGGIVRNTGFQRYSIRANVDQQITDNIKLAVNSNYIRTDTDRGFTGNQNNSGASIGYNIAYLPNYYDIRPNEQGIYPINPYFSENPAAVTDLATNNSLVNRFITSGTLDANLFRTDYSLLKLQVTGGVDYVQNTTLVHLPENLQFQRGQANPGDAFWGKTESFNKNFQAALVYNFNVNKVNLTSSAGLVRLDFDNNSLFVRGRGLAPGQTNVLQATVQEVNQQFFSRVQEAGVFLQQEANWEDKIIGTVGVRWDKSSLNGDPNEFYAFPRASAAFNLTNFDFWNVSAITQLKPRIAYGQTAGPVPFGATFTPLGGTNIGGFLGSVVSTSLGNTQIRPETAQELEFGIDAGFLDNKVSLEATYYIKNTQNNIQNLNLSPSTGVNSTPSNEAELENKGLELALSASVLDKRNIKWFSRVLWWKNEINVKSLGIPSYLTGAFGAGLGTFLVREGLPPTTIVGTPSIAPGEFTVWGNSQPDFTMSWMNNLTLFRNFELSMLWEWRQGGDNINLTAFLTDAGGTTNGWFNDDDGDGIPNGRQRPPAPHNNAGRWVQDASFIKLREVGLFYNVPQEWTSRVFKSSLQRARIGVSGNNVLLFTDYEGYDPETSTFGAQALANNVDVAPYPTTRRLFFHIQLDF